MFCVAGAIALIGLIVVLFEKRGLSFDENKKPENKSTETKVWEYVEFKPAITKQCEETDTMESNVYN